MTKNHSIKRSQKLFLAAMKKKWAEDPTASTQIETQQISFEHVTLIPYKTQVKL